MTKRKILVLGAGKIGSLITALLDDCQDYQITLGNKDIDEAEKLVESLGLNHVTVVTLDAGDRTQLVACIRNNGIQSVISALPYYCNPIVADIAAEYSLNYFDLTEDVKVTQHVKEVSQGKNQVFMPQCGLAPGFISIVANNIMEKFDLLESVKMRVGALPINPSNALKYSLTWSTDGVINEYGNICYGIENGKPSSFLPLEGYETISLDGVQYEAFNTSGGLGTLADTYDGRIKQLNYKTMRYPGHCKKIQFLMNDLKLNDDRGTLKEILENAIPKTLQDVVLIYVSVTGKLGGALFEENYVNKVYPQEFLNKRWSSIQITTAAGVCSVVDIVLNDIGKYQGFITQETINLSDVLDNRFGQYYA